MKTEKLTTGKLFKRLFFNSLASFAVMSLVAFALWIISIYFPSQVPFHVVSDFTLFVLTKGLLLSITYAFIDSFGYMDGWFTGNLVGFSEGMEKGIDITKDYVAKKIKEIEEIKDKTSTLIDKIEKKMEEEEGKAERWTKQETEVKPNAKPAGRGRKKNA